MNMNLRNHATLFLLTLSQISFSQVMDTIKNQPGFEIKSIDQDLYEKMLSTNVFGDHSPVAIDRLRLIKLRYFGLDETEHPGELIMLDACSEQVLNIFLALFQRKFPLEKVALMTEYHGSDSLSMAENNTSGHNLRQATDGERLSLHAYGTAIDLNPVNNPYVEIACDDSLGIARFRPAAGIRFANRMENRLGKVNRKGMAEEVIDVFAKNGFYWWGGYWNCPIDYQHFQISRSVTELLVAMPPDDATRFFEKTVAYFNKNKQSIEDAMESAVGTDTSWADLYRQDAEKFLEIIDQIASE